MSQLDVIILGGGPAGMSAALTAGRSLLKTVIVNAEAPRNAVTTASHGFLTRDGAHPNELLAVSKSQLTKYSTVEYILGRATHVQRTTDGFAVQLANGDRISATRLVVATGQTDDLRTVNIPGIQDVYGKSVYPCVFCDGFEHHSERLAVFSTTGEDFYVSMVKMWSDDVMLFTHGASVAEDRKRLLTRHNVRVVEDVITGLIHTNGRLEGVQLSSGETISRDGGFTSDDFSSPATPFAAELGVGMTENDWGKQVVDAQANGATDIPGLYVIGDARTGFGGLIASAAEGAACMAGIVHAIAAERWAVPSDG